MLDILSPSQFVLFFGTQELLVIFLIVIVLFGASRLPQIGRGLGEGIRNFRKSVRNDDDNQLDDGKPQP
jgi:sec-independent protein translocase protein TatA